MGTKSEHIKLHCTPELKDQVQLQASKKGLSVSGYIRMKLKEDLPQEVEA